MAQAIENILSQLRLLNLRDDCDLTIAGLMKEIGPIGIVPVELPPGAWLVRARPVTPAILIPSRGMLGAPPSQMVALHGRANLPRQSMFYASVSLPDFSLALDLASRETIGKSVQMNLGRSTRYQACGVWRVLRPIPVVPALRFHEPTMPGTLAEIAWSRLNKECKGSSPELYTQTLAFYRYIAEEYSKPVPGGEEWRYRISAQHAFQCCGLEKGVMYEHASDIRIDTTALNVAIDANAAGPSDLTLHSVIILRYHCRDDRYVPDAFVETPEGWTEDSELLWKRSIPLRSEFVEQLLRI